MTVSEVSNQSRARACATFLTILLLIVAGSGALGPSSSAVASSVTEESSSSDGFLLSRHIPTYASSGSARNASDANYSTPWRSDGIPTSLTYDLSSIDARRRQRLLVVWYNDYTYSYDHAVFGWPGYNNPGAYTVEVNPSAGSQDPPKEGWIVVDTVVHNTLHSREHLIDFKGSNWLRLHFTASDGSAKNMDIAAKVDIYDGNVAPEHAWLFVGDSITANGMSHRDISGSASDSFGNQVARISGYVPIQENAGMPGWLSGDAKSYLPLWLAAFPGKYVTLNFGTNDGAGVDPQLFYANMSLLAEQTIARGKIPVIPSIPWASRQDLLKGIPALNAEIKRLLAAEACAVAGPDLYGYFKAHPQLISADGVHPNDAGYAALREKWAQFAAQMADPPDTCTKPTHR